MKLFHGSNMLVELPELRPIIRREDFGVGFYATSLVNQAQLWADRKAAKDAGSPIVTVYEYLKEEAKALTKNTDFTIKTFEGTSESWLDFVIGYRHKSPNPRYREYKEDNMTVLYKGDKHHTFDIVIGEVADDTVFNAIDDYEHKRIDKKKLLSLLKTKQLNDQYAFFTDKSLQCIKTVGYLERLNGVGKWVRREI
jgi:hypothetical protein